MRHAVEIKVFFEPVSLHPLKKTSLGDVQRVNGVINTVFEEIGMLVNATKH